MLQQAIEREVAEYVERRRDQRDENGRLLVTRNGRRELRTLQTGGGPVEIGQPRVHDRRDGQGFTSNILPPYLRRVASIDNLVPALYLRGVSTNSMQEAILGPNAGGLSATNVQRLKGIWEASEEGG